MGNGMQKTVRGFLRAEGQGLINEDGVEVLLRGVGFGGWFLPEGYMWRFPAQGDRPRRIERMIEELIGPEKARIFWETYYRRFISKSDIRQIAQEGFNSVRIPLNTRFLLKSDDPVVYHIEHLQILDEVIEWCKEYELYVILDLHGAPGGQTGTNIDDSERDQPELFTDPKNRELTVALWRMLAKRYRDEWIVAGYDLLNEPLPDWFSCYYDEVMPLYCEIVKAIREVDQRHMIILEGVHWATDWSIFTEKIDDNILLQFHKYWNNPDTESIQAYLDKRAEWDVPIFMGEGGENNKEWYTGAFRLFEDHNISWNFWTWKKMETTNSPCSIVMPQGWDRLVDYLEGGAKPDAGVSEAILWEYLDNIVFEHCIYRPEVVCSIFRRPPVRIPAIFYGYKGEGKSFGLQDKAPSNLQFRMNDGTAIHPVAGIMEKPNFHHGAGESWLTDEWLCVSLATGDWLAYEFEIAQGMETMLYAISLHLLATTENGGSVAVSVDGVLVGRVETTDLEWETVQIQKALDLEPGPHELILRAESPIDFQWLELGVEQA
ncbi:MAG: cellulase family glycosylhydrolase [Firmicutes bacterium]|nr:cellulase family glycosylhydrolase [Bacillota bacterium]